MQPSAAFPSSASGPVPASCSSLLCPPGASPPVRAPRCRGYFPIERFPLTHGPPARFARSIQLFGRLAPTVGRMALPSIPHPTSRWRAFPHCPKKPPPSMLGHSEEKRSRVRAIELPRGADGARLRAASSNSFSPAPGTCVAIFDLV